ncbi:hypothetical protein DV515_00008501 [Chloebia gouldiae]|uniref:Uncharacterized protein n=1 Tax=Chloebia gouldiae TaxID=44316 RepID=A0A3L8SET6_CHLGU|nr:hypothetical protein DV515_00008501 [Chloebia gouldiae]
MLSDLEFKSIPDGTGLCPAACHRVFLCSLLKAWKKLNFGDASGYKEGEKSSGTALNANTESWLHMEENLQAKLVQLHNLLCADENCSCSMLLAELKLFSSMTMVLSWN